MAKLHAVLATPSSVDPEPTATVDAGDVRDWQRRITSVLEAHGDTADAELLDGLVDDVAAGRTRVLVQRVHGDLHVGRVLRWTRGLSVVGFDAAPAVPYLAGARTMRPAAADVARLLASLARVAAAAARRPDDALGRSGCVVSRDPRAGADCAYRSELAAEERTDLLDERLLAAFEAAERAHAMARAAGQPTVHGALTGRRPVSPRVSIWARARPGPVRSTSRCSPQQPLSPAASSAHSRHSTAASSTAIRCAVAQAASQ